MDDNFIGTTDLLKAPVSEADVAAINALMPTLSSKPRAVTQEDVHATLANGWICVVRTWDGHIVSMATLLKLRKLTGYTGSIEDVVTAKAWQGRGLARTVLTRLHLVAMADGMVKIDLTSNPTRERARRLYESLGYELRDTGVFRFTLPRS